MSNHDLQSLKRSFRNFNRLANFDGAIDSHDFFRTHTGLKRSHNIFRQSCQADRQNGRSLEFRENFQRPDVVSNRQISRTDSQETWPLRTRPGPVGSSSETQSRGETLDRQTDAGARSRPNARALAASLDKTKLVHGTSASEADDWVTSNYGIGNPKFRKIVKIVITFSFVSEVRGHERRIQGPLFDA